MRKALLRRCSSDLTSNYIACVVIVLNISLNKMDSINSKVLQISLLVHQASKVRKHGVYLVDAEFTRLKNILAFCGNLIISNEHNIRSETFDRFDSNMNVDMESESDRYDTPSNMQ